MARSLSAEVVRTALGAYDGAARTRSLHLDGVATGFDALAAFCTKQYGHASVGLTGDSTGADVNLNGTGHRWFWWFTQMVTAAHPGLYVRLREFDGSTNITDQFGNGTGTLAWRPAQVMQAPAGVSRAHVYCVASGGQGITHTINPSQDTIDLDVAVEYSPDSWATAGSVWQRAVGGGFDQEFRQMGDGTFRLRWYDVGGTLRTVSFSAPSPAVATPAVGSSTTPGTPLYVRTTLDVDNGSSGYTARLLTSPTNDGFNWTVHQTVTVAGVTTMRMTPGAFYAIGSAPTFLPGNYYEVWVRAFIDGPLIMPVHVQDWAPAVGGQIRGGPSLDVWNASWPGNSIDDTFDNATRAPWMTVDSNTLCWIISTSHNDNAYRNGDIARRWEQMVSNHRAVMPKAQLVAISQNPDTGEYASGDTLRQGAPNNNGPEHTIRTQQLAAIWDRLGVHGVDTARAFYEDPRAWTVIMNGQHHPNDDTTGLTNQYDLKTGTATNPVVRQAQLVFNAFLASPYATTNSGELTRK